VGAWGPAIFSDDLACDIRDDYRELLEDQVPDDEATRRVIDSYRDLDDDDEMHLLWLALAAAQSQLGRLTEEVKTRALDVIDTGRDLRLWEETGDQGLAERRAAFSELFAPGMHKSAMVGMFLAILELVRHHSVRTEQGDLHGEIWVLPGESFSADLNLQQVDNYERPPIVSDDLPVNLK